MPPAMCKLCKKNPATAGTDGLCNKCDYAKKKREGKIKSKSKTSKPRLQDITTEEIEKQIADALLEVEKDPPEWWDMEQTFGE